MKKLYNKIMGFVGGIPADKALHFIAGMLVAAIAAICVPQISSFAFVIAFACGLAKEVIDLFTHGTFSDKDLLATAIGGVVMQIFIWLL
jgi:hypothetical protein